MEEKLMALVDRIERSNLLDRDKDHLYVQLRYALEAAVTPVLIAHVSKDTLHRFTQNLAFVTPEVYIRCIADAMKADTSLIEAEESMIEVLDIVSTTLTESGIA